MNMEGWVLLGADKQEVPVVVYPGQDLVEADLSDVPDVYQDLHWHAPKTYLGDKVRDEGRPVERFCSIAFEFSASLEDFIVPQR